MYEDVDRLSEKKWLYFFVFIIIIFLKYPLAQTFSTSVDKVASTDDQIVHTDNNAEPSEWTGKVEQLGQGSGSCQRAKHAWLFSDLLQAVKGKQLLVLGYQHITYVGGTISNYVHIIIIYTYL